MIAKYRHDLPQFADNLFLTDGGIETTLIYQDGFELPSFAAFDLLRYDRGRAALRRYFQTHAAVAQDLGVGFVLESATWRASADWGAKLGYDDTALAAANLQAIALLHALRAEYETCSTPIVISGCIGPRGDGYKVGTRMTSKQAEAYHSVQTNLFAASGADLVTAMTMTYSEEAIGITLAAQKSGMPVAIAFTTETDGRLPSGETLESAITCVDDATGSAPAYYVINCAHPTHFTQQLQSRGSWMQRVRGLRANASAKSHAELDTCTELDAGNPLELAARYAELRSEFPQLTILGGCCGTDHRHIRAIGEACVQPRRIRPTCTAVSAAQT